MSKAFEKVPAFIERHSMLDGASGIVVAVSGGADSVALLDMLARIVGLVPNPYLRVAYLDHQLRGIESSEDAKFVERFAQSLNLPITIESIDVRAQAEESGRGIEETAREARYRFLLAAMRAVGFNRIATGHTMSDQAETFLMRLSRGAGLRGLAAMRPVSCVPAFDAGPLGRGDTETQLIRPLLCVTREEIENYCRERGLEFRNDATNESLDYARNRVRHEALPSLRRINPKVVENIAHAAEILSEAEDALDFAAGEMLERVRVGSAKGMCRSNASIEVDAYSVPEMLAQPAGLRRRVILEAVIRARRAGIPHNETRSQITSAHVAQIEKLIEEKASGNRAQLPDGLEVWREFDAIVFKSTATSPPVDYAADECEISPESERVEAGGLSITIERGIDHASLDEIIERVRQEKARSGRDWTMVALDDLLLPERLVARPRRAGETALVSGKRRTIKLKNLMIGHRIPASRRNVWPVVVTPDDRYVWSPGLPPALEFAASDKSRKLAILRASGF